MKKVNLISLFIALAVALLFLALIWVETKAHGQDRSQNRNRPAIAMEQREREPYADQIVFVLSTPFQNEAGGLVLQRLLLRYVQDVYGTQARVVGSKAEVPNGFTGQVHELVMEINYQYGDQYQNDSTSQAIGRAVLEPVIQNGQNQLPQFARQIVDILVRNGKRTSNLDGYDFSGDQQVIVSVKRGQEVLLKRLMFVRVKSKSKLFGGRTCHSITGVGSSITTIKQIDGLPLALGCGYQAINLGVPRYAAEQAMESTWVHPWLVRLRGGNFNPRSVPPPPSVRPRRADNCIRDRLDKATQTYICVDWKKDPVCPERVRNAKGEMECVSSPQTRVDSNPRPRPSADGNVQAQQPDSSQVAELKAEIERLKAALPQITMDLPPQPTPTPVPKPTPVPGCINCQSQASQPVAGPFVAELKLGDGRKDNNTFQLNPQVQKVQNFLATVLDRNRRPLLVLKPQDTRGVFGPATQTAIRLFQAMNNLPQTGAWDAQTLAKANEIRVSK